MKHFVKSFIAIVTLTSLCSVSCMVPVYQQPTTNQYNVNIFAHTVITQESTLPRITSLSSYPRYANSTSPMKIDVDGRMVSAVFGGPNNNHAIITCIGKSGQLYKEIVDLQSQEIFQHSIPLIDATFSLNNQYIAAKTYSNAVIIFDTQANKPTFQISQKDFTNANIEKLTIFNGAMHREIFTENGEQAIMMTIPTLPEDFIHKARICPRGELMAIRKDKNVHIIDIKTRQETVTAHCPEEAYLAIFSPTGEYVVTAAGKNLYVIPVKANQGSVNKLRRS